MKTSRYNVWLDYKPDIKLVYNAMNSGFAQLSISAIELFNKVAEGVINPETLGDSDKEVVKNFRLGGYLVDNTVDELSIIKMRYFATSYANQSLSLTILPSLECNFKCSYCFEEKKSGIMKKPVIEKIKEYVKSRFAMYSYKSIGVSWFGGEPLLGLDIIRELSEFFIDFAKEKQIPYEAHMVSNAWLLDGKTAEELSKLHVRTVQVTIDGPKKYMI